MPNAKHKSCWRVSFVNALSSQARINTRRTEIPGRELQLRCIQNKTERLTSLRTSRVTYHCVRRLKLTSFVRLPLPKLWVLVLAVEESSRGASKDASDPSPTTSVRGCSRRTALPPRAPPKAFCARKIALPPERSTLTTAAKNTVKRIKPPPDGSAFFTA